MPLRKKVKIPQAKEHRLLRPDAEQLALLEKAIFHSFKLSFSADERKGAAVFYDGKAVKPDVDLKDFFKLIVQTYATI